MSSGATRYGISFSAGGLAQPAVTPATPMPTSFRKSRRSNTTRSSFMSVMTDQAVHRRRVLRVGEVLPVAAHAPAHLERAVLVDAVHVLDRTVALLAGEARAHVTLVVELHVVGQVMHFHPRHLLAAIGVARELHDLRLVRGHELVAAHARAHGGDVRPHGVRRAVVAVLAVHLVRAGVDL